MSPRPLKPEGPAFEACVELARGGRHRDAVRDLECVLGATQLHPQIRARAVQALEHISRMAEAAGDLESAEAALVEAVRHAPQFADLRCRLGGVRLSARKHAEARQDFEAALALHPRYLAARVELALLDAREGRLAEALETLRRLGREVPADTARLFERGLEGLEHADWDEAGARLRHALQLDDPGVNAAIREFHASIERGDRAAAAAAVRAALREHEGYADLHYLLGTAELEEERFDDALSSFGRALEIHPNYHAARVQLARVLEALGDLAQGEEQVDLVLEADPQHPQALELHERWSRMRRRGRAAGPASPVSRQAPKEVSKEP